MRNAWGREMEAEILFIPSFIGESDAAPALICKIILTWTSSSFTEWFHRTNLVSSHLLRLCMGLHQDCILAAGSFSGESIDWSPDSEDYWLTESANVYYSPSL